MNGLARIARGRWQLLVVVALAVLCVGVPAAYAALGAHDTPTGTGALASSAAP
jgi:hypothetical protein